MSGPAFSGGQFHVWLRVAADVKFTRVKNASAPTVVPADAEKSSHISFLRYF
jgi:hypothetical protein